MLLRLARAVVACVGLCPLAQAAPAAAAGPDAEQGTVPLRVVGGLSGLNQYTRHEAPFWTETLPRVSGGRYRAEIVPFDRAGIRPQEMLTMVRLGMVPLAHVTLSQAAPGELELAAPDLPGLNPDAAALRRTVAAVRPALEQLLRTRHGVELLAVFTHPAQVLYCRQPITGLSSVQGRRVRTSSTSQSDWVQALGGQPVATPFGDMVAQMKSGALDCAITGTMSGNTIGLHEHTTHLHTMAVNWGLSAFVVHGPTWQAMPADLRTLLRAEMPRLEAAIWNESLHETEEGIACNAGLPACRSGRPGRMTVVRTPPEDDRARRDILARAVLPRWLQRCGPGCAELWNQTLAPAAGVAARLP